MRISKAVLSKTAMAAALMLAAAASHAQVYALDNPTFDTAPLGPDWGNISGGAFLSSLGGAQSGASYADVGAGQEIYQSFQVSSIGDYLVSFWGRGEGTSSVGINYGGAPLASTPAISADWTQFQYTFTAANVSSYYYLHFHGPAGTAGLDVDSVSISAVTAVPEPESYAMMVAGLAALGFMTRRRQQSQA